MWVMLPFVWFPLGETGISPNVPLGLSRSSVVSTLSALEAGLPTWVAPVQNTLSRQESRQGFKQLTFDQWIGWRKDYMPKGWTVSDGVFTYDPKAGDGGDIMTKEEFGDFELRLEWKVAPGGNSGIFFRADPSLEIPWFTGPEMQVLDNKRHSDGKNPLSSAGANYAMHPVDQTVARPAMEWNEVRLIAKGKHVEHWLNGKKVVEYDFQSPAWMAIYEKSKFKDLKEYGTRSKGRIVLQDHGDFVCYRNIRIRKL